VSAVGSKPSKRGAASRRGEAALTEALAAQKQIEAELRAALAAQDQAFRKLSHRLKNNLQLVISIVSLRLSALHDAASRRELEDVLSKIHALALIQKKLHDGGTLLGVDFAGFLHELTSGLERPTVTIEPVSVGIERAVPLGLIANELIGLTAPSDAAPLAIALTQRAGTALLSVGPLAPAALEATGRSDLGLPLAHALARQAQAELTIEPGPPVTARLSFAAEPAPTDAQ
jgi:hypothetical protein